MNLFTFRDLLNAECTIDFNHLICVAKPNPFNEQRVTHATVFMLGLQISVAPETANEILKAWDTFNFNKSQSDWGTK